MAAVLGVGVEVLGRVEPVGRGRGRFGAEAPPASAASTPEARTGVEPMLTRLTPAPPSATATPTMAQSWARRLNFW